MTYLKQTPVVEHDDGLPLVPALRTVQSEPADDGGKTTWKQYFVLLASVLNAELAAIALGKPHTWILDMVVCFSSAYKLWHDTAVLTAVYFVQGILGLSGLAISFYLKDDLRLEPAQVRLGTQLLARKDHVTTSKNQLQP
jgi:hypothetical protein